MRLTTIALVALCARGAVAREPPRCDAKTQLGMNDCARAALRRADRELRVALEAARQRAGDDDQRRQLDAAQLAWEQFRVAECAAENAPYRGGSVLPMRRDYCLAGLAFERAKALATFGAND